MRRSPASPVALCGVLGALAVVIMCLGGIIPFATFACPVLCMAMLIPIAKLCGRKFGWVWYCAVALLTALLCPDKEAAALFAFLGYYPLIKPWMDKRPLSFLWKLLYFALSVSAMYSILIYLFGMGELAAEFSEAGTILGAVTAAFGILTFFMVDMLLSVLRRRF